MYCVQTKYIQTFQISGLYVEKKGRLKKPKDKERECIISGLASHRRKKKSPKPAVWYLRGVIKQTRVERTITECTNGMSRYK